MRRSTQSKCRSISCQRKSRHSTMRSQTCNRSARPSSTSNNFNKKARLLSSSLSLSSSSSCLFFWSDQRDSINISAGKRRIFRWISSCNSHNERLRSKSSQRCSTNPSPSLKSRNERQNQLFQISNLNSLPLSVFHLSSSLISLLSSS